MSPRSDIPVPAVSVPTGTDLPKTSPASGDLFSWTVVERDGTPPHLGTVGVSSDRRRATVELVEAVRDAPDGAYGLLHKAKIRLDGRGYRYDRLLARAHMSLKVGAVVLNAPAPASNGREPACDIFAEIARHSGTRPAGSNGEAA
jgi:hypothetical protein